jgi:hypothetical protein
MIISARIAPSIAGFGSRHPNLGSGACLQRPLRAGYGRHATGGAQKTQSEPSDMGLAARPSLAGVRAAAYSSASFTMELVQ